MDNAASFLAPRRSFLDPIPELDIVADLLGEAADALVMQDLDLAGDRLRQANMPAVHAFAYSIMGKETAAIHRVRSVVKPSMADKAAQRMPGTSVRGAIFARDGWRCRFCGIRVVLSEARKIMISALPNDICWSGPARDLHAAFFALSATADHIVPHALGGDNDPQNLVTACWPCNFGRMARLIEEVGLIDPRTRPPVVDGWDGLRRVMRYKSPMRSISGGLPPALAKKAAGTPSHADWLSQLDGIQAGLAGRLVAFLANCEDLQVSWTAKSVLIVRMIVNGVTVQVFGIEPNGSVHIPWAIGEEKACFRHFAEQIAGGVPNAIAYETPKMWAVRKRDKTPVNLLELLAASASVRLALEILNAALAKSAAQRHPGLVAGAPASSREAAAS